ncbi:MAG: VCBS repeat-containing protein [Rhodospirillales bacterium]|nr:VCBS repeat-containing protein [Rhodospirillales bacterium]
MQIFGAITAAATLAIAGIWSTTTPAAGQSPGSSEPIVIRGAVASGPVTPDVFDGDLRDLPKAKAWKSGDPIREIPRRVYPRRRKDGKGPQPSSPRIDPLLELQENAPQDSESRDFSIPDLNIDGFTFTGVAPPDTVGDVGPNHYIQMVNSGGGASFVVTNKTSTILVGPLDLDTLGVGNCAFGKGDPIVLYDRMADRWLMSEFSDDDITFANSLCVYVSQTPDPVSGGWFRYEFATPNFPDYPKYAVWPDAYYVSTNELTGPAVYALDRTSMLAGSAATSQRFTAPVLAGFGFQALIPADLDGANTPPANSPGYFMRHRDDESHNFGPNPTADFLEVWEFDVDFATPANSTFTGPLNITVSEFDSNLCGLSSFFCFPQPGTTQTLDPLREVVMWRLQYRNFGGYETLVGNLVTDVDGTDHGGIRWFELRKTGAGAWSLFQEGTYAPDAAHRWMGSIAMDGNGNMALGYSISSSSIFPSIRYTGRLDGDTLGQMTQTETTIVAGAAPQTWTVRWGDYSAMSVDPSDDCTFVYTNEYVPAGGLWATRIAVFKFPTCDNTPPVASDFNANTRSDILWRNTSTGGDFLWQMNGLATDATGPIDPVGTAWVVEGLGDFDGDRKADILWRNTGTGSTVIWRMDGFTKLNSASIGTVGSPWIVAGLGDFDGDRKADILWRNTGTGANIVWRMDGFTIEDTGSIGGAPVVWEAAGLGDFNGDTKVDILWRKASTGADIIWLMNGFTEETTGSIGAVPVAWEVAGLGDTDGDGKADIVWRNPTTGSNIVWQMNGLAKDATGSIGAVNSDWRVDRIGDYDGSGKADILWRHTVTGRTFLWLMDGFVKVTTGSIGVVGLDWQVQ